MKDKNSCEECGKDEDFLFSTHKSKDREGNPKWVCESCFCKIEGVSFEDYGEEYVH